MPAPDRYALPKRSRGGSFKLDLAAAIAIALPALIFVAALLASHLPPWSDFLSGREIIGELTATHPPPHPNMLRNGLELLSFAASTLVIITAAGALFFTLSQIREARDARFASIYMEINNKYNAPYLVEARRAIRRLSDAHKNSGSVQEFGAYVARTLAIWSHMPVDSPEYTAFSECVRMMQFWEDVGGLVRQTLVEIDIVLDFHVGAVRHARFVFGPYIAAARQARPEAARSLYANALWLMDQANRFEPFAFP